MVKCKYEGTGIWNGRCIGTKEVDPCPGYDKCERYKPDYKTNADRIRSMSDEEFAEFWLEHCDNPIMEFNEDICDLCNTYKSRGQCDDEYCKNAILKWLQSDVENQR